MLTYLNQIKVIEIGEFGVSENILLKTVLVTFI